MSRATGLWRTACGKGRIVTGIEHLFNRHTPISGVCSTFPEKVEAAGIEPAFALPSPAEPADIKRRTGFVL